MDEQTRNAIESLLGYTFKDPALLRKAFTHASLVESRLESNERMEFLGDAVLGMVVCEAIYHRYPEMLEGEMTKIKSLAVSRQTCSAIAKQLGLGRFLSIGKGMMNGEQPASLSAAALESVIAAIFLDGGFEPARAFLLRELSTLIDRAAASSHQHNFKSFLQQHSQQNVHLGEGKTPVYLVLDEQGPDHSKCFKVAVELGGRRFAPAWGQSKKRAEQLAALHALRELGAMTDEDAATAAQQAGLIMADPVKTSV